MNIRWLAAGIALLIACPLSPAQERKGPGGPTEVHERLAKRAGDYETSSKFSFPGGKATETKGTAKINAILGGRFLQEESSGTLMDTQVNSLKLLGYNAEAGQYEAVWMYTGSTAMMTMSGKMNEATKSVEFAASVPGPKGAKMNFTIVYKFTDADSFTVELTARGDDGSKGPTMETTYTRKK
jgi:Protein of unknown function (DUF1579)